MNQKILTYIAIALALFFALKNIYKTFSAKKTSCGTSCGDSCKSKNKAIQ